VRLNPTESAPEDPHTIVKDARRGKEAQNPLRASPDVSYRGDGGVFARSARITEHVKVPVSISILFRFIPLCVGILQHP
jgi:hypothetical protein